MVTRSENRKHHRYNLPKEVKVQPKGTSEVAAARDISAEGVYFTVPADFKAGSKLEFLLVFPAELVDGIPPRIRCQGRLLRVDRENTERIGVAATIESYDWVRD